MIHVTSRILLLGVLGENVRTNERFLLNCPNGSLIKDKLTDRLYMKISSLVWASSDNQLVGHPRMLDESTRGYMVLAYIEGDW